MKRHRVGEGQGGAEGGGLPALVTIYASPDLDGSVGAQAEKEQRPEEGRGRGRR
jgi:hypothetical protein